MYNNPAKNNFNIKKIVIIAVSIVGLLILLVVGMSLVKNAKDNQVHKFVCTNNNGSLTIYYNAKKITDYETSGVGITFNMSEANTQILGSGEGKDAVAGIGVDGYLASYGIDFNNKQGGSCAFAD